jgi:hypothetical protein
MFRSFSDLPSDVVLSRRKHAFKSPPGTPNQKLTGDMSALCLKGGSEIMGFGTFVNRLRVAPDEHSNML